MNQPGDKNRSVRNTKRKLRETLLALLAERSINEVSVKELTERANVNRGTFYFHYSDVYDMLRKIEDEFFAQFDRVLQASPPTDDETTFPYLRAVFSFLEENHDFCRLLLGPNGDMQFLRRVKALVEDKCAYFWKQAAPQADVDSFAMYNAFIINGCVGVIQAWLDDGLREPAEEISQLAGTIILTSLKACIAG